MKNNAVEYFSNIATSCSQIASCLLLSFSSQNVLGRSFSPRLSWFLGARVVFWGMPVSSLLRALRVSRCANSRHPFAGARFPSTPPANSGEPCRPSQTPSDPDYWMGNSRSSATSCHFFFHLIICTVYTIAKQTEILAFNFRFNKHIMYLYKAQQHLYAFLPLNLCYLPPSLQVYC